MKKMIVIASALLVMSSAFAADTAAPSQPQTVCPVMGGKINTNLFVDAEGKRVYICCPGCLGDLKADPAKYIKKLEAQGVKLEPAPKPAVNAKK
ncbi:MAG: hypothetical protein NTY53_27245 [Kiritimatiellaeota bacterium]|nr:hypothetical protein [Kiritimatiellota bacterium]